jgi:TonB family protein
LRPDSGPSISTPLRWAAAAPKFEKLQEAPRLERRQAQAAAAQRKGVEIEGPLSGRKVVAYSVPPFPDWASRQGIMEAEVAIRFTVDAEGAVMPGMSVERTSGYGRLDRLAMDSLRSWRFAPAPGTGAQWGVITFRFIQE